MARSFFAGTDADLFSSATAFSALINESPESYGLTEEACLHFAELTERYRVAYQAVVSRGSRTIAGVYGKNDAREALCKAASALAKIIAAMPFVTDSQRAGLGLNVRAKASPLADPGKPTAFRVELGGIGELHLSWKCKNPRSGAGTSYMISRRIDKEREFTFIGRSGKRKFTDDTVPMGSSSVNYRIQAVRTNASGPIAEFSVNFGILPGMAGASKFGLAA